MEVVIRRVRKKELVIPLTLIKAETKTGIPASTLSDYERGRSEPTLSVLEQLAKGYGVYIEDLYDSPKSHPLIIQYKKDRRDKLEEIKRIKAAEART